MFFEFSLLKQKPVQKPIRELIKVITPINTDGNKIGLFNKLNDMPAPRASILVAIDTAIKNLKESFVFCTEQGSRFSFLFIAFYNFK